MIYKAYGVGQAFLTRAFWGAVAPMSKNVAQVHLVVNALRMMFVDQDYDHDHDAVDVDHDHDDV